MARSFNGTSDFIQANSGNVFQGTRNATSWSFWVNGAGQQNKTIYCDAKLATNTFIAFGTANVVSGAACRVIISNAGGTTLLDTTSTAVIANSAWHHVCFTLDASGNWKLYIDGALDSSGGPLTSATSLVPTWAAFGALVRNTNTAFFSGRIAHVSNFTVTLSADHAVGLAAGLPATHLGPSHYWPLWGADSPEPEITSGSRRNGTLTGTTAANEGRVRPDLLKLRV